MEEKVEYINIEDLDKLDGLSPAGTSSRKQQIEIMEGPKEYSRDELIEIIKVIAYSNLDFDFKMHPRKLSKKQQLRLFNEMETINKWKLEDIINKFNIVVNTEILI